MLTIAYSNFKHEPPHLPTHILAKNYCWQLCICVLQEDLVAAGKTLFGKQNFSSSQGQIMVFCPPTIELMELAKHGLGKCEIEADNSVIYLYTLSNLLAKNAMEWAALNFFSLSLYGPICCTVSILGNI